MPSDNSRAKYRQQFQTRTEFKLQNETITREFEELQVISKKKFDSFQNSRFIQADRSEYNGAQMDDTTFSSARPKHLTHRDVTLEYNDSKKDISQINERHPETYRDQDIERVALYRKKMEYKKILDQQVIVNNLKKKQEEEKRLIDEKKFEDELYQEFDRERGLSNDIQPRNKSNSKTPERYMPTKPSGTENTPLITYQDTKEDSKYIQKTQKPVRILNNKTPVKNDSNRTLDYAGSTYRSPMVISPWTNHTKTEKSRLREI